MSNHEPDALNDGWDDFDVEDIIDNEENDDDEKLLNDSDDGVDETAGTTAVVADGWGDEDAFFDDDDLLVDKANEKKQVIPANNNSNREDIKRSLQEAAYYEETTMDANNGWEDEIDDLRLDDDDVDVDDKKQQKNNGAQSHYQDPHMAAPPRPPSQKQQELENYLQLLPHLRTSVNAVLKSEYNTPQKASEVLEYFKERPGLVDYTIEKELPRMDYIVIEGSGLPIQEKDQIAAWMVQAGSQGSLLPRCANQSLLADLLQAMTGPDMLIRPQFLATAIATSCKFVLDVAQESVLVNSRLELTIPTEEGRWKVADLAVFCQLNVASPTTSITYRLDVVKQTEINPTWRVNLSSAARLIESMELPDESFLNVSYQQSEDGLHYRDAFLQQSQTLLQNSAVGFRSALKEIDAVAGISNKLSKLPVFLSDDVLEAADRVHERPPAQTQPEHRPTSILGGFLSSGFSRLAQTVNLPEEDTEYYKEWNAQQQQSMAAQHDHRPTQSGPGVQLYNRQEPSSEAGRSDDCTAVPGLQNRGQSASGDRNNLQTGANTRSASPKSKRGAQVHTNSGPKGPAEPNVVYQDGWEMDDEDVFSPDELAELESESPWEDNNIMTKPVVDGDDQQSNQKEDQITIDQDWVYDPETDIIPTRKRWVNPRPGPRTLEACLAGH